MDLQPIIKACQEEVGVVVDGEPGEKTWRAIYGALTGKAWETPVAPPETQPQGLVDARSEGVIATLLPEVRPVARRFVQECAAHGIEIKIISGTRTYAEQDALYEQGRSKPGDRVTNARGGHSNHNFGLAFDIGVFNGARYIPESPIYKAAAVIGKGLGLSWGGDWQSINDEPHYELKPSWARNLNEAEMLAELRDRHEANQPVFT